MKRRKSICALFVGALFITIGFGLSATGVSAIGGNEIEIDGDCYEIVTTPEGIAVKPIACATECRPVDYTKPDTVVDGTTEYPVVDNPDWEVCPIIVEPSPTPTPVVETPTPVQEFLITYLDCYGETVKVEWVPYQGNGNPPSGYTYDYVYQNVSSNLDIKPLECEVPYVVVNTADRG